MVHGLFDVFDFGFYAAQAATQVGFHVYAVTLRFADDGDDFVCIRMTDIMPVCLSVLRLN